MSDIHIGAFRQPELKSLVLEAFEASIDRCVKERVAFVIMAGDIFDSNIPDLSSVRRAAAKMKEAIDSGIRFYVIYGSHDFSPNYASIVDVLDGAGLFTKAEEMSESQDRVALSFVQDPSGPKICGISGRKLSLDKEEYAVLDKGSLEAEPGFKIFVFHGALEELKPPSLEMMDAMPAANLPSGFNYYAGGHVHSRTLASLPGMPRVAYPGPLFATDYSELLQIARGEDRGFYLVDFNAEAVGVEFIPVKVAEVVEFHYSAEGKTSGQASEEMTELAGRVEVRDKVVLLTVDGKLADGKTSDIDFSAIRKRLETTGPRIVLSNYAQLSSKDLEARSAPAKPVHVTEREMFEREIAKLNPGEPSLRGAPGVETAMHLLQKLKEGKKENENRGEFEDRTTKAGFAVLGIQEER